MGLNMEDICVWLIFADGRLALSEGRAKCVGRLTLALRPSKRVIALCIS